MSLYLSLTSMYPETGTYYQRNRYFSPDLGRFISRGQWGMNKTSAYGCSSLVSIWRDEMSFGNGYTAFADDPLNIKDSMGYGAAERLKFRTLPKPKAPPSIVNPNIITPLQK